MDTRESAGGPSRSAARRILIAEAPSALPDLLDSLHGLAELVPVGSLDEALAEMRRGVDLVVTGLHFDDIRMIDLLADAKRDPALRHVPFLCLRELDPGVPRPWLDSLRVVCAELGATRFLDGLELRASIGSPGSRERVRSLVHELLRDAGPDAAADARAGVKSRA